jgi:hypothetical protein
MANPFTNAEQVNALIKVRRGPEIERQQFQYEDGELIYSTDKKRLFVGDGVDTNGTLGGILVGNKTWYVDSFDKLPYIQKYDTVYRTDLNGEYVYYGNNYLLSSNYVLVGGRKLITDNVNISDYQLPNASTIVKGGVIVGSGLKANNGTLAIDFDPNAFTLNGNKITLLSLSPPPSNDATYLTKGIVKVNDGSTGQGGIRVVNGSISVGIDNATLKLNSGTNIIRVDPLVATIPATTSLIGGLILGAGLSSRTDTGLTNVNVDNNTIKISPANALYVDTAVVGGGSGSGGGGGGGITLNDGADDLAATKLVIGDGLEIVESGSDATLSLPIATAGQLGGVKVGTNGALSKTVNGLIAVSTDNTSIKINSLNQLEFEPNALSTVFANTQAQNGGVQIAGQIAFQWGMASFGGGTTATITFPRAFQTTCWTVYATHTGATGAPVAIRVSGVTSTGATLNIQTAATMNAYWFAVGDS